MNDNGSGVVEGLLFRCFARESTIGPQEEMSLAVNPLEHVMVLGGGVVCFPYVDMFHRLLQLWRLTELLPSCSFRA